MNFFKSFKVCVMATAMVAGFTFVSCGDDDDDPVQIIDPVEAPAFLGSYDGDLYVSGEMNGRKMFEGTVNGTLAIEQIDDTLVKVTVPEIVELNAGRSIYSVKAFTIDSVRVEATDEGYSFNIDNFELEAVSCDQGDGNGYADFDSHGYLKGTYQNNSVNVEYTFTLGRMPFPLKGVFEGGKK